MFTNGYTDKGFSTKKEFEIEERIYLFKNGSNMTNIAGYWGIKDYDLYNGKQIMKGNTSLGPGGVQAINSAGAGSNTCVLLGTSVPVSLTSKRYLVIEAKVSDINAAQDFNIIVSRSKELSDDSSTVFYSFAFKTIDLKFYIDLSELTNLTRAYIAIAGGAIQNWRTGGTSLSVKNVYLTNIRYNSSILPLYNRGQDYNSPIERGDADYLIGWEGFSDANNEPGTLENGYISMIATSEKNAAIQTIRALDVNALRTINVLFEVTELVESGMSGHLIKIEMLTEQGTTLDFVAQSFYSTGRYVARIARTYLESMIQNKNKIRVRVAAMKAKVYAIWMET